LVMRVSLLFVVELIFILHVLHRDTRAPRQSTTLRLAALTL
jgi:hypothetical protein